MADDLGGENLLIDTRDILAELSPRELEGLKSIHVPLPRSEETLPLLTVVAAVKRFHELLSARRSEKKFLSVKLKPGQAIWFNNFVMLRGRELRSLSGLHDIARKTRAAKDTAYTNVYRVQF